MRAPTFTYEGDVFNPYMHDDLCEWLFRNTSGTQGCVLLVAERSVWRSLTIAASIGRAIGAIESTLAYTGFVDPAKTARMAPVTWRARAMPGVKCSSRVEWKAAAVRTVNERYKMSLGDANDNVAEAILINDATVMTPTMWRGKREAKP
jgi:hypothetical protein